MSSVPSTSSACPSVSQFVRIIQVSSSSSRDALPFHSLSKKTKGSLLGLRFDNVVHKELKYKLCVCVCKCVWVNRTEKQNPTRLLDGRNHQFHLQPFHFQFISLARWKSATTTKLEFRIARRLHVASINCRRWCASKALLIIGKWWWICGMKAGHLECYF